jgi:molybdopterin-guanine dinucleotide biosynthesis protein
MQNTPIWPDQLETLHASAVAAPAGVVALCARSGTGKSTLAERLRRRGYDLWADDAVVWTASGSGDIVTFAQAARSKAMPLAAILVLERLADATVDPGTDCCRMTGASALTSVLPHAHPCPSEDERRQRDFLLQYVHLAATLPVVRVRFQPDPLRIDALCDTLERLLASLEAPCGAPAGR